MSILYVGIINADLFWDFEGHRLWDHDSRILLAEKLLLNIMEVKQMFATHFHLYTLPNKTMLSIICSFPSFTQEIPQPTAA